MKVSSRLKVINLYGGPSTGKSVTACRLFADLKVRPRAQQLGRKLSVELVTERAKELVYETGSKFLRNQAALAGEQFHRLDRLAGHVDVAVTDSPLYLCAHYADPTIYPQRAWVEILRNMGNCFDEAHIWLRRSATRPYESYGRVQTEAEALQADTRILHLLMEDFGIEPIFVDSEEDASDRIVSHLLERGFLPL
jgi:hypothetical protein